MTETVHDVGPVDAHAHVFRSADRIPRAVSELVPLERDAPAEDLLAQMDSEGVQRCLLVPLDGDDTYVAETVSGFPDRFLGLVVATEVEHGLTGQDPVESLRRRRESFPFVALRTGWLGPAGASIEESPMFGTLRYLADERLVLWAYLGPGQLDLVAELAQALPELRIVLNHLGLVSHDMWVDDSLRPGFDNALPDSVVETVASLARFPSVYLMLSGLYALSRQEPPYADYREKVGMLAAAYGPERMLWGSDYPWIRDNPGYGATRDVVRQLLPDYDDTEIALILGGTALSLFQFPSHKKEN